MRLYSSDRSMTLSRYVGIEDEHGKRMKAIDVFSICIKYLAEEFTKLGRNRSKSTVDVIVHEIVGDKKLKELTSASGGP
ncbi:hypothetical protein MAR_008127 [Mya arenaria]|uniref:Uncharacterized protein n=1 Tax=Mya arenaria TaxID=6604 RepID=A0ABY7DX10_MYAAR|nr:hypothetical protein MAR_008127 [Mya arenaria]